MILYLCPASQLEWMLAVAFHTQNIYTYSVVGQNELFTLHRVSHRGYLCAL